MLAAHDIGGGTLTSVTLSWKRPYKICRRATIKIHRLTLREHVLPMVDKATGEV
jgi:hypothetical protein